MKRLLIAILSLALLISAPAFALADEDGELSVTGTGVVKLQPDVVYVTLGISETREAVVGALSSVNEKAASVVEAIKTAGVAGADISTQSFYVYANYNYDSGAEAVANYVATCTLSLVVRDVSKAGAVIDAAFGAGANQFNSFEYGVSDSASAYDQALALAITNAQHKAQVTAKAANVTLGKLSDVTETSTENGYVERGGGAYSLAADAGAGTELRASQIEVVATVRLTYDVN